MAGPDEREKASQERAKAHQEWKDAQYKAWRKQYPDEPYHAGWDRGYEIKGFEVDPFEKNISTPASSKKKAKGGSVKDYAKGGKVSSASKRADGCATKGKTKGRFV